MTGKISVFSIICSLIIIGTAGRVNLFGEDTITIKAVGDIVSYSDYPAGKFQRPKKIDALFDQINPYLQEHDLLIGNFEGPITTSKYCAKNTAASKFLIAFRYPPGETENLMKKNGFTIAHIANNHSRDFGEEGLYDTIRRLTNAGLDCVGLKNKIIYKKIRNITVAVIGFNYAGDIFNNMYNESAAVNLVKEARTNADVVVITMHAGAEGINQSHVIRKEEIFHGEHRGDVYWFAHLMVDNGADCLIGFSPHIMRGMEMYKGKVIAYSLGNFMGYGGALSRYDVLANSGILELKLTSKGNFSSGKIIPVTINENGLPVYDEKMRTIGFLNGLSTKDFPESEMVISTNGEFLLKQ